MPLIALAALGGCGVLPTGDCTTELGIRLSPTERTVGVGESFVVGLELSGCGGRHRWRPAVVWRSADTLVVRVDSASGRIAGRAPGDARVKPVEHHVNGDRPYPPVVVHVQ